MKFGVYAIRDQLTGYMQPTIDASHDAAVRNFLLAVKSANGVLSFRPADFDLMCIASFDSETGLVKGLSGPELVITGSEVSRILKEDEYGK